MNLKILLRPIFYAVTILAFSLPTKSLPQLIARAQKSPIFQTKIGEGVQIKIEKGIPARVVVALFDPNGDETDLAKMPLPNLNQQVAYLQKSVLAEINPTDFQLVQQFKSIPALTGIIHTRYGLSLLERHPFVQRVDLDVGGKGSLANSVPLVGANTWHTVGVRGDDVVVAVLDSGVDTDHSDLSSALIHQACFLDNDGRINGVGLCPNFTDRQFGNGAAEDDAGHGTHVTGIIASRGIRSSVGVAPGSRIVALKVTAGPTFSGVFYYFSEIVAALDYLINNPQLGVKIINMSLGTNALFSGNCDMSTSWTFAGAIAINSLRNLGVITFASAGNNGSTTLMTAPACLSNVISVGATTVIGDLIWFSSNRNSATDLVAPGAVIQSSAIGDKTTYASGTSMASPHAAGCAALLIEARQASSPDQIEAMLEASPVRIFDPVSGLSFSRLECRFSPIAEVSLIGMSSGLSGYPNGFSATIFPPNATQPITYTWEASLQEPIYHYGGVNDNIAFTWQITGTQWVTVTAQNVGSKYTTSRSILLTDVRNRYFLSLINK